MPWRPRRMRNRIATASREQPDAPATTGENLPTKNFNSFRSTYSCRTRFEHSRNGWSGSSGTDVLYPWRQRRQSSVLCPRAESKWAEPVDIWNSKASAGQRVDVRVTDNAVEVALGGEQVLEWGQDEMGKSAAEWMRNCRDVLPLSTFTGGGEKERARKHAMLFLCDTPRCKRTDASFHF